MIRRAVVLPVVLVLGFSLGLPAAPARAEGPIEIIDPLEPPTPRYLWAFGEIAAVTLAGTAWYWANTDLNDDDWELHWDLESWRQKVTPDGVKFDTNAFYINARNHPAAGVAYYQIARTHGFGLAGAFAINLVASTAWEYVVEFKEIVSLNDVIVNSSAGISIGEPLIRIGEYLRSGNPTATDHTLAFAISPFDGVHRRVIALTRRPWHRFALGAGLRDATFGDELEKRTEVDLAVDLELVLQEGYGQPGTWSASSRGGTFNRVAVALVLGDDGPEGPVTGVRLRTQTNLFGRFTQDLSPDRRGISRFIGGATAFTYDTRRLPGNEHDRLAIVHLLGPMFELGAFTPDLTLRWETAAYANFGMVDAHAIQSPPIEPGSDPLRTSSLRAQGYYFGYGATVTSRLRIELDDWTTALSIDAHHLTSIDSMDRTEHEENPHGLSDQRVVGRVELGFRPGNASLAIIAAFEAVGRRGTWGDLDRRTLERGGTASLGLIFR